MNIDFTVAEWINQPKLSEISKQSVKITTEPNTDFWQGTYYGFRNDNAHSLLLKSESISHLRSKYHLNIEPNMTNVA